jgi:hypothetical protein
LAQPDLCPIVLNLYPFVILLYLLLCVVSGAFSSTVPRTDSYPIARRSWPR